MIIGSNNFFPQTSNGSNSRHLLPLPQQHHGTGSTHAGIVDHATIHHFGLLSTWQSARARSQSITLARHTSANQACQLLSQGIEVFSRPQSAVARSATTHGSIAQIRGNSDCSTCLQNRAEKMRVIQSGDYGARAVLSAIIALRYLSRSGAPMNAFWGRDCRTQMCEPSTSTVCDL